MSRSANRSVLISGCSSGIGLASARHLATRGWRVLATCRRPEDCRRLREEGLESFVIDLSDPESVARGALEALDRCEGHVPALFNNGAFALPGVVEDLPRAGLREIFETNLFGQIDLTNRLLPAMRVAGHGRIVMNSSVLGFVAAPFRGAYVATKFALEGLTDTLRLELAGSDIDVVLLQPGPITSRIRQNAIGPFETHINWKGSARRSDYERRLLPRLYSDAQQPDRFELRAEAVARLVAHILECRRPRPRYRITLPTTAAAALKWMTPTRILDRLLDR